MKRLAALLFALTMLLSVCTAEEAFHAPVIPEFTASYGLYELYTDLQADWGPVQTWTLEQKAWLSYNRQLLLNREIKRCDALGVQANIPFRLPLRTHNHGLPDEKAINQTDALDMAVAQLTANGFTVTEDGRKYAGFYYLIDDPAHPVWWFSFLEQHGSADIYMDAYTGQFALCSTDELLAAAKAYLPQAAKLIAKQPTDPVRLDDYDLSAYYMPTEKQWRVALYHPILNHELIFIIDDATCTVIEFDAANG